MSNSSWYRRPWPALLAILIFLAALAVQLRFDLLGGLTNGECKTTLCCEDCRSVRVTRIIDGDTFDSGQERVRLYGVDAPERNEQCHAQATDRLSKLAGSSVLVQSGERPTDPNGRRLFYVYTKQSPVSLAPPDRSPDVLKEVLWNQALLILEVDIIQSDHEIE